MFRPRYALSSANAQVAGPVDMLGNTDAPGFLQALQAVFADPANDAILAIMVPHLLVNPVAVVEAMAKASEEAQRAQANRRLPDG